MKDEPVRKLAAILAADAVGFTSRVAENETTALRAIKASIEVLDRVIGMHNGRVVKTMGDGLLAEFNSVVSAVSAASTIQTRISERKRDLPDEAVFEFRMGVHVGDVVVDGDDILGDGVNIAARLEAEASPGSVLVSGRVYEDVVDKLDLSFEDLGERQLPGVARPIRMFTLAGTKPRAPVPAPIAPDKPSVAILPFVNLSPDVEQDYFADGLTEDIITALASVPWLFVIARNSSFSYKGAAVDVRKVGRELGVRYILEGSVRRSGDRLRVTGQLVDTETGAHLWADRKDGKLEDIFDLQDQITDSVVAAIGPQIQSAEQERAFRKRPESLTAYDLVLQAMGAINRAQISEAIKHLDAAIEMSPGYAKALGLRAWVHTLQVGWLAEGGFRHHRELAIPLARQAYDVASDDVEVVAHAAYATGFFGVELDRNLRLLEGTVAKSPSFMWAWASLGMQNAHHHDPEKGILACDKALRLSPRDPMAFRAQLGKAASLFYAQRWEEVVPVARAALDINPNLVSCWVYLVTSLSDCANGDDLNSARNELLSRFPETTISRFRSFFSHFTNYAGQQELIEQRMKDAGLRE